MTLKGERRSNGIPFIRAGRKGAVARGVPHEKHLRFILTDVGGVLVRDQWAEAARILASEMCREEAEIRVFLVQQAKMLDVGTNDLDYVCKRLNARFQSNLSSQRFRKIATDDSLQLIEGNLDFYLHLKKCHGINFVSVTNVGIEIARALDKKFPALQRLFTGRIQSFQFKRRKPDAKLFTAALRKAGVRRASRPEGVLYVDDDERCVGDAERSGIDSVLVKSPGQLVWKVRHWVPVQEEPALFENSELRAGLVRTVRRGDAAWLFVGSGFSLSSGVPTGTELRNSLWLPDDTKGAQGSGGRKSRRRAVDRKDPFAWLGEATFADRRWALRSFFPHPIEVHSHHSDVGSLVRDGVFRTIVTTNFDELIERGMEKAGIDPWSFRVVTPTFERDRSKRIRIVNLPQLVAAIDNPSPPIKVIKIFGDLRSEVSLFGAEVEDSAVTAFMKWLLTRDEFVAGTGVVLGYSLQDGAVIEGIQALLERKSTLLRDREKRATELGTKVDKPGLINVFLPSGDRKKVLSSVSLNKRVGDFLKFSGTPVRPGVAHYLDQISPALAGASDELSSRKRLTVPKYVPRITPWLPSVSYPLKRHPWLGNYLKTKYLTVLKCSALAQKDAGIIVPFYFDRRLAPFRQDESSKREGATTIDLVDQRNRSRRPQFDLMTEKLGPLVDLEQDPSRPGLPLRAEEVGYPRKVTKRSVKDRREALERLTSELGDMVQKASDPETFSGIDCSTETWPGTHIWNEQRVSVDPETQIRRTEGRDLVSGRACLYSDFRALKNRLKEWQYSGDPLPKTPRAFLKWAYTNYGTAAGTSLVVVSTHPNSFGCALVAPRSRRVELHSGYLQFAGTGSLNALDDWYHGHVWSDLSTLREGTYETSVRARDLTFFSFMGFGYDMTVGHPQFLFYGETPKDFSSRGILSETSEERFETGQWKLIEISHPPNVFRFLNALDQDAGQNRPTRRARASAIRSADPPDAEWNRPLWNFGLSPNNTVLIALSSLCFSTRVAAGEVV